MPGKIEVVHHTLTDWDFEQGATGRSLSDDHFISAPTSLKLVSPNGVLAGIVLCRIPATLVLPQGEVRTWIRAGYNIYYPCVFRNQAALGSANMLNCYRIVLGASIAHLYRYVDGVLSFPDTTTTFTAANEWVHYRFFWYNGKTPAEQDALCVDHYREVAGEWVKLGDTMYDTDNYFKDSEINRCGFYPSPFNGYHNWFDDTEIWGPV